jgi:hypothetical protein
VLLLAKNAFVRLAVAFQTSALAHGLAGAAADQGSAIALANKIARMAWAMMARGERYKEPIALAR